MAKDFSVLTILDRQQFDRLVSSSAALLMGITEGTLVFDDRFRKLECHLRHTSAVREILEQQEISYNEAMRREWSKDDVDGAAWGWLTFGRRPDGTLAFHKRAQLNVAPGCARCLAGARYRECILDSPPRSWRSAFYVVPHGVVVSSQVRAELVRAGLGADVAFTELESARSQKARKYFYLVPEMTASSFDPSSEWELKGTPCAACGRAWWGGRFGSRRLIRMSSASIPSGAGMCATWELSAETVFRSEDEILLATTYVLVSQAVRRLLNRILGPRAFSFQPIEMLERL